MDDGGVLVFQLVIGLVLGFVAAAIASNKGRSGVGWFFGGFFLGLIGVIIVACLSNLKEEQDRQAGDREDKRRLREQLRQEQLKSESYRQYTMERLDNHDEALGIDTKQTQIALPSGGAGTPATSGPRLNFPGASAAVPAAAHPSAPPPLDPYAPDAGEIEYQWFYADQESENRGPYTLHELRQLSAAGVVTATTLVWSENLTNWTPAGEVADVQQGTI